MVITLDFYTFYQKNVKIKDSLNRAVKGASLQLDTKAVDQDGNNLAAQGVFLIEEEEADKAFRKITRDNIALDENFEPKPNSFLVKPLEILEYEVLNDYKNMPYEFESDILGHKYVVKHPAVFVVCSFRVQSIFLKKDIVFAKLASSELVNVSGG